MDDTGGCLSSLVAVFVGLLFLYVFIVAAWIVLLAVAVLVLTATLGAVVGLARQRVRDRRSVDAPSG